MATTSSISISQWHKKRRAQCIWIPMHHPAAHLSWLSFYYWNELSLLRGKTELKSLMFVSTAILQDCYVPVFRFVYLGLKLPPLKMQADLTDVPVLCQNGYRLKHGQDEHVNLWNRVVTQLFSVTICRHGSATLDSRSGGNMKVMVTLFFFFNSGAWTAKVAMNCITALCGT